MKVESLNQNSPEWHAFRAEHFGASEAAAMLGLSKYTTRTELLHAKKTGFVKDHSEATKYVFAKGHETEAAARPLIEEIIGEQLSPVTCSEGKLSCSCDGITFDDSIAWEHKQFNAALFAAVQSGNLPDEYQPQCQQILMITGAKKLIFTVSDGTREKMASVDVYPDSIWWNSITQGWSQFSIDLENYQPIEALEKPKAEAIMALPAVVINVTGELSICNLSSVTPHFDSFLKGANTSLVTDDDFAKGEATAKFSRTTAKTLKLKAKEVVDQIASVSEAVRTLELYADKFDKLGLQLEKAVKEQKEAIKAKILHDATMAFRAHVESLEAETRPIQLNVEKPDFAGVMKNQRMIESLHDKVNTELARVKILADAVAKDVRHKISWMNEYWFNNGGDYKFLFSDLQNIIDKPMDDFKLIITVRIASHKSAETAKLEAERARIQEEEEAKARAKIQAEQLAMEQEKAAKPHPDSVVKQSLITETPTVNDKLTVETPEEKALRLENYAIWKGMPKQSRPTRIQIIESLAKVYSVPYSIAEQWLIEEFSEKLQ